MKNVNLERWRGKRDPEVLDPASIAFTSRPARSCKGCMFDGQWASVCNKAVELAVPAGLGHCEFDRVIYIEREVDPRQLEIEVDS